jgi:hypothetical protein
VWADATRPRFVDIVGPYKKWGGDNVDAFYQYAPIDPTRTYRVRGRKGDAVYFSLSVYGGPDDGRYSERIVGTVNDRMLEVAADGRFEITLSPHPHPGAWLRLEPFDRIVEKELTPQVFQLLPQRPVPGHAVSYGQFAV